MLKHTICAAIALGSWLISPYLLAADAQLPKPTPAQVAWQDAEVGVIFHLYMPIVAGTKAPNNETREVFAPQSYHPSQLDTDAWLAAAKSAEARYAIFTATHFNGFMQWQSDLYPYGLKQSPWRNGKGDIVGDFTTSCRKLGIKPGLYLSTHRNAWQHVWSHYVDWGKGKGTPQQAAFNRIAEQMTEELCTRYGDLIQIWYDAGVKLPDEGGPDVLPIFQKHQPNSVFYNSSKRSDHRWIGNEAGVAGNPCWATMPGPEHGAVSHNSGSWNKLLATGDPEGSVWAPAMADTVLRGKNNHDWFWHPNKDNTLHTVKELLGMYDTSVGRNCNLVIGVVVDQNGQVPAGDAKRLAEFGAALRQRYTHPLATTSGKGESMELAFHGTLDTVMIMEDITQGERIRDYTIDGRAADGSWKSLCSGKSIGHKRIQHFPPTAVTALRMRCSQSKATPIIRQLAAFRMPTE